MTIIWCMVPEILSMRDRIFCPFGPFFALLPHNNPKNRNFEKLKKMAGDIIILHKYIVNENHMIYGSWDMKHEGQNFSELFFEKLKKSPGDIITLHKCTRNHDHMLYCSLDMACNGFNYYFSFWAIFCPLTSLTAQKI